MKITIKQFKKILKDYGYYIGCIGCDIDKKEGKKFVCHTNADKIGDFVCEINKLIRNQDISKEEIVIIKDK